MNDNILNQEIDESVVEFILGKLDEYKSQLETAAKANKVKVFESIDKIVAERESEIKEELSARMISKLKTKNDQIAQLEEQVENFKETLAERINTFLANSKNEVRALVEEEIRHDSETLKAQHIVDDIRAMVGNASIKAAVAEVDDAKIARLSEDVEVLKERVKAKDEANQKLKAKLRVFQLVENAPAGDREFYLSQLSECASVAEADEKFSRIKKAIKVSRSQLYEDVRGAGSRGVIAEDRTERKPRVNDAFESSLAKMERLAGL